MLTCCERSVYQIIIFYSSQSSEPLSNLSEENIQLLPLERVRHGGALLAPGAQCRICLRGYQEGQYVRKLPCQHKVGEA